ncbi:hypothetical protein BOG92_000825 [Streptomyces sp. WAC00263]|nr:hypothetical protein BOG92_000825 [Streptomyces sp. WAC00263]
MLTVRQAAGFLSAAGRLVLSFAQLGCLTLSDLRKAQPTPDPGALSAQFGPPTMRGRDFAPRMQPASLCELRADRMAEWKGGGARE